MTDATAYFEATQESDERLRAQQDEINAAADAGRLTPRQAIEARVSALEDHLGRCRAARRRWLEPGMIA